MSTQTLSAPHGRTVEALEVVSDHYALSADLEALHRAGDRWEPLAIAMLAEAERAKRTQPQGAYR